MPDISQLQRFVVVATERNFRCAAARLHVSQPPLSESILQLEKEVGSPLLLRTRPHVELTRPGEVMLERARLILSQLDESVQLPAALPADHRLASREQIGLHELRNEPFVFIPPRWGTGYHARVVRRSNG